MNKLRICKNCLLYTLEENCPSCFQKTSTARPLKYSKEDKYADYRRKSKFSDLI